MNLPSADFPLFGHSVSRADMINIDLTRNNPFLESVNLDNRHDFELFINNFILQKNVKAAIGGYLEDRVIYRRSSHFTGTDALRSIHLGIDIWLPENTEVYAPLPGIIHSYGINDNYADYGGTLILQHLHENVNFWTLYGHISHDSLDGKMVGDRIAAGDLIARLGSWDENGNWPPHLHFQAILDMMNYAGDFPGVCALNDKDAFSQICPDPSPLIFSGVS
jgi:murein DD-endopeptidase MepM/ murein hydrolase activator NlpD